MRCRCSWARHLPGPAADVCAGVPDKHLPQRHARRGMGGQGMAARRGGPVGHEPHVQVSPLAVVKPNLAPCLADNLVGSMHGSSQAAYLELASP